MAVLRIWRGKRGLDDALAYVENHQKTSELAGAIAYAADEEKASGDGICYISAINCLPETAAEEMCAVKRQYGKTDGRQYYHAKQSFHPDEQVSAEEVHRIGVELARKLWGDYQVVITTHLDKAHLHNHFIINSVAFADGKKFSNRKADIYAAREANDRICRAHGLTTLKDKRYRGKSYQDWAAGKGGYKTLRDYIKEDIDLAVAASTNMEEFFFALAQMGYTVKEGKHLALHPAGYVNGKGNDAYIRLRSLNDSRYTKEGIAARLRENYRRMLYVPPVGKRRRSFTPQKRQRLPYYQALYYKYLYQMGKMPRRPRFAPAAVRADAVKMRELEQQIKLINRLQIKDKVDLDRIYEEKTERFEQLLMQREKDRRLRRKEETGGGTVQRDSDAIGNEIISLRKEIKTLEKIQVKTGQMQLAYAQLRTARQKKGDENVFRSTGSGYGNIHHWSVDSTSDPDHRRGGREHG